MPYIDAEKMRSLLEEEIEECGNPTADDNPIAYGTTLGLKMALSYAKTLPTADAAPVVHAHWERLDFPKRKRDYYRCTNCGRVRSRDYDDEQPISEMLPFCNCGAKMDEDVKGDEV